MNIDEANLSKLIESVQLLAADYELQITLFPNYVQIPDEIALIFDDCFLFVKQLKEQKMINKMQLAKLQKLDNELNLLSDKNEELWTLDSLRNNFEWEKIRVLAKEVLDTFNVQKKCPNIDWVQYIE